MYCKFICRRLPEYVDGSLSQLMSSLVDRHLEHCLECRTALFELTAVRGQMHSLVPEAIIEPVSDRIVKNSLARAKNLSAEEIAERQQLASSCLPQDKLVGHRPRRWALVIVAAVLLFVFLVPSIKPFALRAAADIPILGPWARKVVLTDAGLSWAWQNGYVLPAPIVLEQAGYKLTVVGYLADPIQTSLIYLVDGPGLDDSLDEHQNLCEVGLLGASSAYTGVTSPIRTPLGILRVAYTNAVAPEGEQMIVYLKAGGDRASTKLWVTPKQVASISSEQVVDRTVTVGDAELTLHRIVRTPAQLMLELWGKADFRVTMYPILRLDNGRTLAYGRNEMFYRPLPDGKGRFLQLVFDPPDGAEAVALELDEVLIAKQIDGPVIDPVEGLTEATLSEGAAQITIKAWKQLYERPGLAVEVLQSGYLHETVFVLEWDCYTAAGEVFDASSSEIDRAFRHSVEGDWSGNIEYFWRHEHAAPIVRAKVKQIMVPYGPVVFDLGK